MRKTRPLSRTRAAVLACGQAKTFERVDDFPKLWAKLQEDDALEDEGRETIYSKRTGDGSYTLTNDKIFNVILQEVNSDVLGIDKPDHVIFLEFARSSYVEAFQSFDQSILDQCIAIHMRVSFDTCWARNVAGYAATVAEDGNDHWFPRKEMEKLYLYDDQDAFVQYLQDRNIPVAVVNNEANGEEHLQALVKDLVRNLFSEALGFLGHHPANTRARAVVRLIQSCDAR